VLHSIRHSRSFPFITKWVKVFQSSLPIPFITRNGANR
jgi:hypothetical protein